MLQVKNLVKRYTTKGESLLALDHVSVNFPEKGMVFLLGKSGSGKSTLLNVSGGLDTPDEGEIIVKGKSSKDFSASDFDSYRNTYVGFIFQEYNILNELTVAENVALALELQGKPCDKAYIDKLLRQVDLEGYGDRRPNTLSGGQKQRVAIARALVKNPEIIMGDEPTGALDSATGKQVFDTLKKLSEEKLVVIVSHDREFAESYADRIIELKDGKIISDVTRGGDGGERSNLNEISEKKLSVVCGAALTQEDETRILDFVRKTKGSLVISSEKEDVGEIPSGSTHVGFVGTVVRETEPEKDESRFIKSKFPFRYALKMGISGLRVKPLRLVFTALLATIAFIVFGVFSTLITYDTSSLGASTLKSSSYSAAVLEKYGVLHMQNGDNEYTSKLSTGKNSAHFSQAEIEKLQSDYPKMNFIPAYTLNLSLSFSSNQSRELGRGNDFVNAIEYLTAFADVSTVMQYLSDDSGQVMSLVAGTYPEGDSDCLISLVVYQTFLEYGYLDNAGNLTEVNSYEDVIGKLFRIYTGNGYLNMYISGIVDTYEDFSEYEILKDGISGSGMKSDEWNTVKTDLQETFSYSMASLCFVKDGFYERNASFDSYVNGNDTAQKIRSATGIEYFVSSNYLTETVFESDWGTFRSYAVNPESEAEGSYVQYLFSALNENRDYKSKTIMKLDAKEFPETDVDFEAPYSFMSDIRTSRATFTQIYAILGSAAVVLALFAALLLFNFIAASINAKKKDIGILRAVGARGIDVFKIFVVEGIAITLLCFALGCLGSLLACALTNSILVSKAVLSFKLFSFGWANVLIVLAIAFLTTIVATAIPVALTVRKKPVEAIRSV